MHAVMQRIVVAVTTMLVLTALSTTLYAAEVGLITKEELKDKIDSDNVVVIDVRSGSDWRGSEFKIKNAVRLNPGEADNWGKMLDMDKEIVLYCA